MTREEKILYCDRITCLENDIRRVKAQVTLAADVYEQVPTEQNYATWVLYQGILDDLEDALANLEE